jgi:hypothetical protein
VGLALMTSGSVVVPHGHARSAQPVDGGLEFVDEVDLFGSPSVVAFDSSEGDVAVMAFEVFASSGEVSDDVQCEGHPGRHDAPLVKSQTIADVRSIVGRCVGRSRAASRYWLQVRQAHGGQRHVSALQKRSQTPAGQRSRPVFHGRFCW